MDRSRFEALGDKHKRFEVVNTSAKLIPGLPFIVRLDGNAFHTFTKGMARPYDLRLSDAMVKTTEYLVSKFNADIGYTQSDEITLGFLSQDSMMFDGRVVKLCTIMAASCTAKFNQLIQQNFRTGVPSKVELPVFDARAFNVPTIEDLIENIMWRQTDASRNSLTMAAHAHFSNTDLHKASKKAKHDMLMSIGINWNDYPYHFKRGTFVRKQKVLKHLDAETLAKIPENKRPQGPIERNVVGSFDAGILESMDALDRYWALFGNAASTGLFSALRHQPSGQDYVEP